MLRHPSTEKFSYERSFSILKYLSVILIFGFTSCIKESVTLSYSTFYNSTSHQIKVLGYYNGNTLQESSFDLNPNEMKSFLILNNRGIGNGLSFGEYYQPLDSIVVIFDSVYNISHYKPNLTGTNSKFYPFTSDRNIFNGTNYTRTITKDRKYRREWDFKYTFVEQDYSDAR
jgi:hypothetical protein